ncbi:MAG: hypothetical protein KatS3mg015_0400 [Fimbriimonadales bacterium]|nr:MAG: hypothetical protein KatS3mg015_0400 [Fimbriimonadales bacterium]
MEKVARMRKIVVGAAMAAAVSASAQVPDLFDAFEMGGRSLGMGGGMYSNAADPSASYWNPANLSLIGEAQFELNFRNLPATETRLSGRVDDPERDTNARFGGSSITFGGIVLPIGTRGTLGVSYARGGFYHDREFGIQLDGGDGVNVDINDLLRVDNEFLTVAWGLPSRGRTNIGVGVVLARQHILSDTFRRIDDGQETTVIDDPPVSDDGFGVGGIVGFQFTPPNNPNVSFGISYRTPIRVNMDKLDAISNEIPGRLQAGFVWRRDGLRGGRDYLIGGVDGAWYFEANRNKPSGLKRDGHAAAGVGIEYNWAQSFGYVPIRLGFRAVQDAGDGFASRSAFTFGVGYRPFDANYWIDLNLAAVSGQSSPDLAISITSRIGKK